MKQFFFGFATAAILLLAVFFISKKRVKEISTASLDSTSVLLNKLDSAKAHTDSLENKDSVYFKNRYEKIKSNETPIFQIASSADSVDDVAIKQLLSKLNSKEFKY